MRAKTFEDLEIWKLARDLANRIYLSSNSANFSKDFALRDQIRRAAISVMSNISEGYERGGNQEFIQFLSVAKGSCGEIRAQIYLASDQGYISKKDCNTMVETFKKLSIMIHNLSRYLRQSTFKGAKYKNLESA